MFYKLQHHPMLPPNKLDTKRSKSARFPCIRVVICNFREIRLPNNCLRDYAICDQFPETRSARHVRSLL